MNRYLVKVCYEIHSSSRIEAENQALDDDYVSKFVEKTQELVEWKPVTPASEEDR